MDGNDMNFGAPEQPTENQDIQQNETVQPVEEAQQVVEPEQVVENAPIEEAQQTVEPEQVEEPVQVLEPEQVEEFAPVVETQPVETAYTAPEQSYTAPEQTYTAPQPDPYVQQTNYGTSGQSNYGTPVQPPYGNPQPPYGNPGQPYYGAPASGDQPGKSEAVGSLACGILSLVFCLFGKVALVGVILGIVGLVLASMSKKKGFEGGIRSGGFICSLIGLIFGSIVFVSCAACSACTSCIGKSSLNALKDFI